MELAAITGRCSISGGREKKLFSSLNDLLSSLSAQDWAPASELL